MKSILVAATMLGLTAGCSPAQSVVRTGSPALSISVYSDTEYTALKPKLKNVDDVFGMPKTAVSVTDGTAVEVTQREMLSIRSDVAPPVDWPFARIRVLSGTAAGREGWISNVRLLDFKPVLETTKP